MPCIWLGSHLLIIWGFFFKVTMAKIINSYFPHDSNARSDRKIIKLRRIHGWAGYGIYFALIEILREQPDFKYPLSQISELEYELRESKEIITSIITNFDLFHIDEQKNFFSISLVTRLQPFLEKSKRAIEANRIRWDNAKLLLNQNNNIQMDIQMDSDTESKENRIEENKIKENMNNRMENFKLEIMEYKNEYSEEILTAFWEYWSEPNKTKTKMRKDLQKTWDTKRRLNTWDRNNKEKFKNNYQNKFGANNGQSPHIKSEQGKKFKVIE